MSAAKDETLDAERRVSDAERRVSAAKEETERRVSAAKDETLAAKEETLKLSQQLSYQRERTLSYLREKGIMSTRGAPARPPPPPFGRGLPLAQPQPAPPLHGPRPLAQLRKIVAAGRSKWQYLS